MSALKDKLQQLEDAHKAKLIDEEMLKLSREAVMKSFVDHKKGDQESQTKTIADHLAAVERRRLQQWRVAEERCATQRRSIASETDDQLRSAFTVLAKDKAVSPDDALVSLYAFFAQEEGLHFFRGLLARIPPGHPRIQAHNFFVASLANPAFLETYGEEIERLRWPLFPPGEEFAVLNMRLLTEGSVSAGGAYAGPPDVPSVFRRRSPQGGEYFAPLVTKQGQWGTDLTIVEDAVSALQNASISQEAKLAQVAKGLSQLHRVRDALRGPSDDAPRGRGRGRRGGSFGGGRGGSEFKPRGGETAPPTDPTKIFQ